MFIIRKRVIFIFEIIDIIGMLQIIIKRECSKNIYIYLILKSLILSKLKITIS